MYSLKTNTTVFVLLLTILFVNVEYVTCKTVAQSNPCKLPTASYAWDSDPRKTLHEVHWEYGIKYTCYTGEMCTQSQETPKNGMVDSSSSPSDFNNDNNRIMPAGRVPVQLIPIQLQKGNKLRFLLRRYVNTTYPNIYKVDKTAFSSCDVTSGDLVRSDDGTDIFDVPESLLDFGNNFFIVATERTAFISCDIGLRLNVIVKYENCSGNENGVCGGRGVCGSSKTKNNFECVCCGNFKGDNCSIYDSCLSNPCQNDGECIHIKNQTDTSYKCDCPFGYYGEQCEMKADSLCDLIKCKNGGKCTGNSTNFLCTCAPGWTGSQCEVNIDDCKRTPCKHGYCTDKLNGYQCSCYPGYYGDNCEHQHTKCTFSPCGGASFCENKTASNNFDFHCHCPAGWSGRDCSVKVPACDPNPCAANGFCMEQQDGFRCICKPGFQGYRCEINMNDCAPNPCLHGGICIDLEEGHFCRCRKGYAGLNCQYRIPQHFPDDRGTNTNIVIIHSKEGLSTQSLLLIIVISVVLVLIILIGCYLRATGWSCRELGGAAAFSHRRPTRDLTVHVSHGSQEFPLAMNPSFSDMAAVQKVDMGIDNKGYQTDVV